MTRRHLLALLIAAPAWASSEAEDARKKKPAPQPSPPPPPAPKKPDKPREGDVMTPLDPNTGKRRWPKQL